MELEGLQARPSAAKWVQTGHGRASRPAHVGGALEQQHSAALNEPLMNLLAVACLQRIGRRLGARKQGVGGFDVVAAGAELGGCSAPGPPSWPPRCVRHVAAGAHPHARRGRTASMPRNRIRARPSLTSGREPLNTDALRQHAYSAPSPGDLGYDKGSNRSYGVSGRPRASGPGPWSAPATSGSTWPRSFAPRPERPPSGWSRR